MALNVIQNAEPLLSSVRIEVFAQEPETLVPIFIYEAVHRIGYMIARQVHDGLQGIRKRARLATRRGQAMALPEAELVGKRPLSPMPFSLF